jgi:hypothetical protein
VAGGAAPRIAAIRLLPPVSCAGRQAPHMTSSRSDDMRDANLAVQMTSSRTPYTAVPVPGSPGNLWRGCERWPCRSDFQGGTLSGECPAGGVRASAAAGRRLSGVPGRVQDGSGTMRCSRTQLDLIGHDPEPASR